MAKILIPYISLVQFWSPIEVNGSTFLSTADQLFVFNKEIDKRLSSYRRLCLDTLIPIDYYKEALLARRWLPEYNPDVQRQSFHCFKLQLAWDYILIMHFHFSNSLISGALEYLRLYLQNHLCVFPILLRYLLVSFIYRMLSYIGYSLFFEQIHNPCSIYRNSG